MLPRSISLVVWPPGGILITFYKNSGYGKQWQGWFSTWISKKLKVLTAAGCCDWMRLTRQQMSMAKHTWLADRSRFIQSLPCVISINPLSFLFWIVICTCSFCRVEGGQRWSLLSFWVKITTKTYFSLKNLVIFCTVFANYIFQTRIFSQLFQQGSIVQFCSANTQTKLG